MTELFDETEDELVDEEVLAVNLELDPILDKPIPLDARRRLENLLAEKRLMNELNDFA